MRDPSERGYPKPFKALIPRRRFDRRAAVFCVALFGTLFATLAIVAQDRDRLREEIRALKQKFSERCPVPGNTKDRVVSWREHDGRLHCQYMLAVETVVGP